MGYTGTVYTVKCNCAGDIRRMAFAALPTLNDVRAAITRLFASQLSIQPENHILKYLDEDGDLVTLTDDVDIQSVYQTSKTLKVMVYDRERFPPPASVSFQGQQIKQYELVELCQRLDKLLKILPNSGYTSVGNTSHGHHVNPPAYPPRPASNNSSNTNSAMTSNPPSQPSPVLATNVASDSIATNNTNSNNINNNPPYETGSSVYPPPATTNTNTANTNSSGQSVYPPHPPNQAQPNAMNTANVGAVSSAGATANTNVATPYPPTNASSVYPPITTASTAVTTAASTAATAVYPPVNAGSVYPPPPPIGQVPTGNNVTSSYAAPALPAGYAPPPGATSVYPPPSLQQQHPRPNSSGQNKPTSAYPPSPAYY